MTALSPAEAVLAGDRRMAGLLLSRAEAGDEAIIPDLKALYRAGGNARVIGVTGPPGAGKSTMVDQLIAYYRAHDQLVAIIAVDPSSPFTGGAVLGDRVRMSRHAEDVGVLIRSMAARGRLGGLAPATGDAITVLDAMGFDVILVETVGVGQSEIDILAHADTVILLQTAHGGDGVQMVKAGILEIADILVVNKADAPGSDRMIRQLRETAAHAARDDNWIAPVVETEATTGRGIAELTNAIGTHAAHAGGNPAIGRARKLRQIRSRVIAIGEAAVRSRIHGPHALADEALDACIARADDPHSLSSRWLGMSTA